MGIVRDPNRLDSFYDTVKMVHKKYYPDLRFGQLMDSFRYWLEVKRSVDIFYAEEKQLMYLIVDFVSESKKDG